MLSSSPLTGASSLAPCSQEEADTRIILHISDCVKQSFSKVLIQITDTDVVVLAIANFQAVNATEVWIAFGTGRQFKYISVHAIAHQLEVRKARAVRMFHAFTGCDTESFFAGKGKATAWEVWHICPQVTETFLALADGPDALSDDNFETLEHFVVLMYDRACQF